MLNGYEPVFDDAEAYEWLSGLYERGQVSKAVVESCFDCISGKCKVIGAPSRPSCA